MVHQKVGHTCEHFKIRVTRMVLTIEVLQPSLVTRVELPGLVSKQATAVAASTHEIGKNNTSVVVLWIQPNFWWMIHMVVKYGPKNLSKKLNGGGRALALQVAGLAFKICQKWAKNTIFWPVWGSIEGAI